ncbi:MAG: ATP-dependent Clp protease ATP-binding subunit ClpX [Eubacterium sp.]|nr:ATP-dependent Clp protease ATP-binding subunit ClpX [Eubacterium sp.]
MKKILRCSKCGEEYNELPLPSQINGEPVCLSCYRKYIDSMNSFLYSTPKEMFPYEIKAQLDEYVIGQEAAKRTLSVALYQHLFRCTHPELNLSKSNVILVGPTGCGKTLLVETLAEIAGVPVSINSATSLTESGYVGDDVENVLRRLYEDSGMDISLTEYGIVYIDEIDKIARKTGVNNSITRDVGGEGVQQALLKMIDGADINVPLEGGRKHPNGENILINTDDILFIFSGAFEGLTMGLKEEKSIGFNSVIKRQNSSEVTPEGLIEYGLIPEFVGRTPIVAQVEQLDVNALKHILTEPKGAIIEQYKQLFNAYNIDLIFTDFAIQKIACMAYERNVGARGLRSYVEKLLEPYIFKIKKYKSKKTIIIDVDDLLKIAA